jgi:hypothetical protein
LKEPPSLSPCEPCDLRLTPLVVQSSDSRGTAAALCLNQSTHTDRPDAVRPAVPPNDDIVGWPDELLIAFAHSLNAPTTAWRKPTD